MIENATVIANGLIAWHMQTRLHEHGKAAWKKHELYAGYLEGKSKELLDRLAEEQPNKNELVFYREGKPVAHLKGVVWGPVVEMYEGHFIRHLEWVEDLYRDD